MYIFSVPEIAGEVLFPAWVRRCVGIVSSRHAMSASNVRDRRHDPRLFLLISVRDVGICGCGALRRGALPARRNLLNIILAHAQMMVDKPHGAQGISALSVTIDTRPKHRSLSRICVHRSSTATAPLSGAQRHEAC